LPDIVPLPKFTLTLVAIKLNELIDNHYRVGSTPRHGADADKKLPPPPTRRTRRAAAGQTITACTTALEAVQ
jgi:hypothetical protein